MISQVECKLALLVIMKSLLNYILTFNSKIAMSLKCTFDLEIYKITRYRR